MIHIPFKTQENTISIPRNTDYTGSFTLRITSELTFKKYDFDVTDEESSKRYYKFTIDTTEIEDGEYRYFLIQDNTKIAEGLVQIGDLSDSIPSILFYDAFSGRENIQYYPVKKSYIVLNTDEHLAEQDSAITYSVRTNVPSTTQMFIRHHTQTEWSPWPPESHTEHQYTEVVEIGPNVEDFPKHFKIVATTQDGTASASTEIVQDPHYYFDVDVFSPSSAIPASATELSYGIQYSEYQSTHTGTFYIYKNDVLIKEQPFGWYPYGYSTYMEIDANTTSEPITYRITGILDNGQNDTCEVVQEAYEPSYNEQYFTIEALINGTITWDAPNLQYRLNEGVWDTWTGSMELEEGDLLSFKGENSEYSFKTINANFFYNVFGNIMSLQYGDNFKNQTTLKSDATFVRLFSYSLVFSAENLILPPSTKPDCYMEMFLGCAALQKAPELPALVCYGSCYNGMFQGCSSLTTAPELPATKVVGYAYGSMFQDCIHLVNVQSALPATQISNDCYEFMFKGCTSLTTAPELPAQTLYINCYNAMFSGCTSLTSAPTLPATTLAANCYYSMFAGCTSLTTAPELPATTLVKECYYRMFFYCNNLQYIKCLATDISASSCLKEWTLAVAQTGDFWGIASTDWTTGWNGIPSNWTRHNIE